MGRLSEAEQLLLPPSIPRALVRAARDPDASFLLTKEEVTMCSIPSPKQMFKAAVDPFGIVTKDPTGVSGVYISGPPTLGPETWASRRKRIRRLFGDL